MTYFLSTLNLERIEADRRAFLAEGALSMLYRFSSFQPWQGHTFPLAIGKSTYTKPECQRSYVFPIPNRKPFSIHLKRSDIEHKQCIGMAIKNAGKKNTQCIYQKTQATRGLAY